MGFVDPTYAGRAFPFDDTARKRDVSCRLVCNSSEFRITLRAVNISNEQETARVASVQMDFVTGADVANVDVAAPSALRGHSVLNSPLGSGNNNAAKWR